MNDSPPLTGPGEEVGAAAKREREELARRRYPSVRRRAIAAAFFLVASLVVCLVASFRRWSPFGVDPHLWIYGFMAAIGGLLIAPRFLWRCPACDQRLGETWNPLQCERCGISLREEGVAVRAITASRTDEELAAVHDAYAKLRRRQFYATSPLLLFLLLELLMTVGVNVPSFIDFRNRWTIVTLVVVVGGMTGFSLWNWRCPACRSYLGKTSDARHCRRCGVELWR